MDNQNQNPFTTTPTQWGGAPSAAPTPPQASPFTVQWSSNGECRIHEQERHDIADLFEERGPSVFPIHGHWGALNLGHDGFTVWLYTAGGAYIAGEVVEKSRARARGIPASGTVEIGSLPPDVQEAIATLLKRARK